MYKGTPQTRANRNNTYFKDSVECSRKDYESFIFTVRFILSFIGVSYESLCRIIDAEGVHVNKDYPSRVINSKCLPPTLTYCNFFASKLNLPLFRLFMPFEEFKDWFEEQIMKGTYKYLGPIVRFKSIKTGKLKIEIIQGGKISVKGLNLDRNVVVTGGRIKEILNNGRVLCLEHFPEGLFRNYSYEVFLQTIKYKKVIARNQSEFSIPIPKKPKLNGL